VPDRDLDTALRVVHDLTQSLWLGGATMGAISIDAAASTAPDRTARIAGVDRAWRRWHKVSTPAIAAHLAAGLGLTIANKGRLVAQAGGSRTTALRTALTGVALASEVAARRTGARIGEQAERPEVDEDALRSLQRRLKVAQWATVVSTATMIGVGSRMSEQQRPRELVRGIASRLGIAA
jgi:hypothetical protein